MKAIAELNEDPKKQYKWVHASPSPSDKEKAYEWLYGNSVKKKKTPRSRSVIDGDPACMRQLRRKGDE